MPVTTGMMAFTASTGWSVFRHECEECVCVWGEGGNLEPSSERMPRKRPRVAMAHQQLAGKGPLGTKT